MSTNTGYAIVGIIVRLSLSLRYSQLLEDGRRLCRRSRDRTANTGFALWSLSHVTSRALVLLNTGLARCRYGPRPCFHHSAVSVGVDALARSSSP